MIRSAVCDANVQLVDSSMGINADRLRGTLHGSDTVCLCEVRAARGISK